MIDYVLKEYYFVAGSLPALKIGEHPEITFPELDLLLKLNLSDKDYEQALVIRRYSDFLNIRLFLNGEALEPHGTLNEKEIEEALLTREGYPAYLFEFLDKYGTNNERLKYMSELLSIHYRKALEKASGFLKEYMTFERDLRRVFAVLRAKRMGRDIAEELKYEDPNDEFIMTIMEQKDAKSLELPSKYDDLKRIFEAYSEEPMAMQKAIYEYLFNKIDEMCGLDMFTLKRILGYIIQLILVENWQKLDQKKGIELIDKLIKGTT